MFFPYNLFSCFPFILCCCFTAKNCGFDILCELNLFFRKATIPTTAHCMFWLVISLYQQGIYLIMVLERCVVICKNNGYFSLYCFSIGNLDLVDLCSRYDIYLNLFSSIFCRVLLWAEDLHGNFLVWLFLVGSKYSYGNFLWNLIWQFYCAAFTKKISVGVLAF